MDSLYDGNVEDILLARLKTLELEKPFAQGDDINAVFTEKEKTLWLVMLLRTTLLVEPFCEYFGRPVSAYPNETLNALNRIGAVLCASAFHKAANLCCGDKEAAIGSDVEMFGKRREARLEALSRTDHDFLDRYHDEFSDAEVSERLLVRLLQFLDGE